MNELEEIQVPCLTFANPPAQAHQWEICFTILSNTTEASRIFAQFKHLIYTVA